MIKFSKLSALLLGGALLVAGCATEADIHKVNERIDKLELGTSSHFESIEKQLTILNGTDADLKKAVEVTLPKMISDVEAQLGPLREADQQIRTDLNTAITNLTNAINSGDQKTAKDAADALKKASDDLNDKITDITKTDGIIDQKVKAASDALQTQINGILAKIGDIKVDGQPATVAEALAALNKEIGNVAKSVTDLESNINGRIGALEGRVGNLETAMDKLTGENGTIAKIQADIEKLKAFQAANESEVQTFKDFIGASKTTLKDIDDAIATVTGALAVLNPTVAGLDALVNGEGGILDRLDKIDGEDGELAKIAKSLQDITEDGGIIDQHINTALEAYITEAYARQLIDQAKGEIYGLTNAEAWIDSELKKYIDNSAADALAAAKEYADGKIKELQEDVIDPLSQKINDLDTQINGEGGLKEQIEDAAEQITEITKEGGLIDKAKADAIRQANIYTNQQVSALASAFDSIINILMGYMDLLFDSLFNQIQSVVYVPDYDDKKITINMARIYSDPIELVEPEWYDDEPIATEEEGLETYIEQPTKIVYKVSPENLAETLALLTNNQIKDEEQDVTVSVFDVKTVKTRDDVAEAPSFEILSVEGDNATGYVTYTVLPHNVASSQFAANRFGPYYKYEPTTMNDAYYFYNYGFSDRTPLVLVEIQEDENGNPILDEYGETTVMEDPEWPGYPDGSVLHTGYADFFRFPIWNAGEYLKWKDRQNFAVALEIRKDPIIHYEGEEGEEEEVVTDFTDISSTYEILYPAITVDVKLLPDLYYMDEDGNVKKDEKGNPMIADGEHQDLPYISKEIKTVLDGSAPAVEIDGEVMSFSEAANKLGVVLPQPTMTGYEYDYSSPARTDENGYFTESESEDGYANVSMGTNELSKLKEAVGDVVTVTYTWSTCLGNVYGAGEVEITKAQAEVELEGTIRWTYSIDAAIDHALFVAANAAAAGEGEGDGEPSGDDPTTGDDTAAEAPFYARVEDDAVVLTVKSDGLSTIGAKAEDFLVNGKFNPTIQRNGASISVDGEAATELPFEYIGSTYADSKYLLEMQKFAWDKEYKVVCYVENESAEVKVTVTITTIDRPRDPIQIDLGDIVFTINQEYTYKLFDVEGNETVMSSAEGVTPQYGYDAKTGLYYGQSVVCYDKIWEAFKAVDEDGKYILTADDFATWEEFATAEIKNVEGEEPKSVSAAEPGDIKWLRFSNEEGYLHTQKSKKLTPKQLKNIVDVIQKDDEHENDNLQRNWCSYIGQEIQILWTLKYEVPGYNFLHQPNYTRRAVVPYANFKEVNGQDYKDKKVWFTQASPLYEESRQVLSKYDVSYMNIEEIAFNVVDENDQIITPEEADEARLSINFQYTPVEEQEGLYKYYTDEANLISYISDEVELPEIDKLEPDFLTYANLWDDSKMQELEAHYAHTTFYYRTYEYFIPMRGYMTIESGIDDGIETFDVPTRFTVERPYQGEDPRYAMISDALLYNDYELVRWTPFKPFVTKDQYLDLDKHEPTTVDILGGISFMDIRPDKGTNVLNFPVMENGVYVFGDGANGYGEGVYADAAYDIDTKVDFDLSELPWDLRKNFSQGVRYVLDGEPVTLDELIEQQLATAGEDEEGNPTIEINEDAKARIREIPTLTYDYTSQIEFSGIVEIPVTVTLRTKWMKEHELKSDGYKIIMRGLDSQTDEEPAVEPETPVEP